MIGLGMNVRDQITGFRGRTCGRAEYLSGCTQLLVVPEVDEKGAFRDGHWFDEQRLIRTDQSVLTLDNGDTPGCDQPAPQY